MLTEGVQERSVGQLGAVPESELPANHLSGFEVKDNRQVVHTARKPQVGKVLHPGMDIDHVGVVQTILRPQLVPEFGVPLQYIEWRWYFWR